MSAPIPDVNLNVEDGGLGVIQATAENVEVVIGTSSIGPLDTLVQVQGGVSGINQAVATFGSGQLVEAAALALSKSGCTVIMCRVPSTYATVKSAVTHTGTGTSTWTIAGTPAITGNFSIVITTAGTEGTSFSFQVRINGVASPIVNQTTTATYLIPGTGITITFGAGSLILNDVYTFTANTPVSAVTQVGTGLSVLTITGNPFDEYVVTVTIATSGTVGASGPQLLISLDGVSVFGPFNIPTSGVFVVGGASSSGAGIPATGLTLNFTAATVVSGDVYSFSASPPTYTLTDLANAMAAILASPNNARIIQVVGAAASSAGAAAMQAALDTQLSTAATDNLYTRALMETPPDTDAGYQAAFDNIFSKRVVVGAGYAMVSSPITGLEQSRCVSWVAAAREMSVPLHELTGRRATGPVTGITSISRDERATPGLYNNSPGFCVMQTDRGYGGFYLTGAPLQSPPGSDFYELPLGCVMDEACTLTWQALHDFLNDTERVQANGNINEVDAINIETHIEETVRPILIGGNNAYQAQDASDFTAQVVRNNNILSTQQLEVTLELTPLGYNRSISATITYFNPAL